MCNFSLRTQIYLASAIIFAYLLSAIHEGNKPFVCFERDGKKKFQCLVCKSEFNEKGSLDVHISAIHEGIKPHKCEFCDYAASKRTTLNLHIAAVHEGESYLFSEALKLQI